MSVVAVCTGCGCDDNHPCEGICTWLRVDYAEGRGVCSDCPQHEARFDAGDYRLTDEAAAAVAARDDDDDSDLLLPGEEEYEDTLEDILEDQ